MGKDLTQQHSNCCWAELTRSQVGCEVVGICRRCRTRVFWSIGQMIVKQDVHPIASEGEWVCDPLDGTPLVRR